MAKRVPLNDVFRAAARELAGHANPKGTAGFWASQPNFRQAVRAAREPLVDELVELRAALELMDAIAGNVWLHGSLFRITRPMTTPEKEAFWAAVKRWDERLNDGDPDHQPLDDREHCWWRDDYAGTPVGQIDPATLLHLLEAWQ